MGRLAQTVAVFLSLIVAVAVTQEASKTEPKVDEGIQKAAAMDAKQAEAALKDANSPPAVKFLALRKLCEAPDDKKLLPLLVEALKSPHSPIKRLAIEELAKRKHQPAAKTFFEIVLNPNEDWQIRVAAEWALEQTLSDFPEALRGALVKAEIPKKHEPDADKVSKVMPEYQKEFKKRFP